jgi:glutamine cyclotransferase
LNELEYIDGFIFANVWQESIILKINPKNGLVEGILDLTALATNKTKDQVLNGIAYIDTKTLLLTGKNWDKMYRIRLD